MNKKQLQQLIKEEVIKQKTIIELENKKVRILKELEETGFVSDNLEAPQTTDFQPNQQAIEKASDFIVDNIAREQNLEEGIMDVFKGLGINKEAINNAIIKAFQKLGIKSTEDLKNKSKEFTSTVLTIAGMGGVVLSVATEAITWLIKTEMPTMAYNLNLTDERAGTIHLVGLLSLILSGVMISVGEKLSKKSIN